MIKKEFDYNSVYSVKYIKTKIKFYNGKFNTKKDLNVICLSVILIDSVYKKDKTIILKCF